MLQGRASEEWRTAATRKLRRAAAAAGGWPKRGSQPGASLCCWAACTTVPGCCGWRLPGQAKPQSPTALTVVAAGQPLTQQLDQRLRGVVATPGKRPKTSDEEGHGGLQQGTGVP